MITLPYWFPWYFLVVGVVIFALNVFARKGRFRVVGAFFGILGIAIAILLWLYHVHFHLR
jgi:hypothetical protein